MTERDFLRRYDPSGFPRIAVSVDLAVVTVVDRVLRALLLRRDQHPARGRWALAGGILQPNEDLDGCASRIARSKLGIDRLILRQFHAFSAPERDPRLRMVSVGYLGLTQPAILYSAGEAEGLMLAEIRSRGGEITVRDGRGVKLALAFDHAEIVTAAAERLRVDLDRTTDAFGLLPPEFTLRDLQIVHEAVRGEPLNKPAFRKRMLDSGRLEPTGRKETESGFRPAELYRLREGAL